MCHNNIPLFNTQITKLYNYSQDDAFATIMYPQIKIANLIVELQFYDYQLSDDYKSIIKELRQIYNPILTYNCKLHKGTLIHAKTLIHQLYLLVIKYK